MKNRILMIFFVSLCLQAGTFARTRVVSGVPQQEFKVQRAAWCLDPSGVVNLSMLLGIRKDRFGRYWDQ